MEKFKIVCRFINPEAAEAIWDKKAVDLVEEENTDAIMQEILSHSKSGISARELRKRLENPEAYAEADANLDRIEVVE